MNHSTPTEIFFLRALLWEEAHLEHNTGPAHLLLVEHGIPHGYKPRLFNAVMPPHTIEEISGDVRLTHRGWPWGDMTLEGILAHLENFTPSHDQQRFVPQGDNLLRS